MVLLIHVPVLIYFRDFFSPDYWENIQRLKTYKILVSVLACETDLNEDSERVMLVVILLK